MGDFSVEKSSEQIREHNINNEAEEIEQKMSSAYLERSKNGRMY